MTIEIKSISLWKVRRSSHPGRWTLHSTYELTPGSTCSSTVNIHVCAQKGYYLEQTCTKCTYKRHIAIKQEVDTHEAGDKAIEKYM
jgi:hypothetical protein